MAQYRMLYTSILTDKKIKELSAEEFRVWIGLLLVANDFGCFKFDPDEFLLKMSSFNLNPEKRLILRTVIKTVYLDLCQAYGHSDNLYIYHLNWNKYQKYKRSWSVKIPLHSETIKDNFNHLKRHGYFELFEENAKVLSFNEFVDRLEKLPETSRNFPKLQEVFEKFLLEERRGEEKREERRKEEKREKTAPRAVGGLRTTTEKELITSNKSKQKSVSPQAKPVKHVGRVVEHFGGLVLPKNYNSVKPSLRLFKQVWNEAGLPNFISWNSPTLYCRQKPKIPRWKAVYLFMFESEWSEYWKLILKGCSMHSGYTDKEKWAGFNLTWFLESLLGGANGKPKPVVDTVEPYIAKLMASQRRKEIATEKRAHLNAIYVVIVKTYGNEIARRLQYSMESYNNWRALTVEIVGSWAKKYVQKRKESESTPKQNILKNTVNNSNMNILQEILKKPKKNP